MPAINFFTEDYKFSLSNKKAVRNWLLQVIAFEQLSLLQLNYIFCSDDYILQINIEYLNHNYFTDVITFDNSSSFSLEGDIFISIPTVYSNALNFSSSFNDELHRVMVHGLLHLIGYDDKNIDSKLLITKKEDFYLSLRDFI